MSVNFLQLIFSNEDLLFEVVFLGTSASAPSAQRGLSSAVVIAGEHRFMIDCGEGTQRQILRSGLGFRRLDKILLTHGHLDHILGLGGLASTLGRWEALEALNIYGGAQTLKRVHGLMEVVFGENQIPNVGIVLNEISPSVLFESKQFELTAFSVQHRGSDCFGFNFEEKTRRPFLPEIAEELGVPSGPLRRDLVAGQIITLPNGNTVEPDQVLGEPQRGTKLCFISDVSHTGPLHEQARDADLLVIESTYLDRDKNLAKQHGHITATAAAHLAKKANVKQLVLHHLSRRYRTAEVIEEARAIFPNSVVVSDLDLVQVRKDKPIGLSNLRHRPKQKT